jgi:hypothetical protein
MFELGGDHMTVTEHGDQTIITFDDKGTGRVCGSCNLCCKLVPVPPIDKKAGDRCQFQSAARGCKIYADRPFACRAWSCRWLSDPSAGGLRRPDRAHYVVDMSWDYITMTYDQTGEVTQTAALQVWVDPAFRDAHRAPELRAFMSKVAREQGAVTIVRWSRYDAITVFPPELASDGQWHEETGSIVDRTDEQRQNSRLLGEVHQSTSPPR